MPDRSTVLDRIEVRHATFRDVASRERADLARRLAGQPAAERVLVETCHRVEAVTVDAGAAEPPAQVRGREAVRRVFEVVAGFDSAVIAEEQLLGQVREAYEQALAGGNSGPILNELFRRALRFGRLVRSHARPGGDRSLADPGAAWIRDRVTDRGKVAVAGTGEMGRLLAGHLASAGHPVTVVSRSLERGRALLAGLPGRGHRLVVGRIDGGLLASVEAVALAVRGREPAIRSEDLPAEEPWVLDLSTPSAVEPAAAARLGERLLDLDALGHVHDGTPVLAPDIAARLRGRLDVEVERFTTWLEARSGADALAVLHGEADAVRRRHLERLRRRASLDESQLAEVESASAAMIAELLHGPTLEIRHGGADVATVRRLFGIER